MRRFLLVLALCLPLCADPISVTPLGDGVFVDLGDSSLNSFGVQLPYLTDSLGGDVPANIPNPLASIDLWQQEQIAIQSPASYTPPVPGPCVNCNPPPQPCYSVNGCDDDAATVPEPSTWAMLVVSTVAMLLIRK